jgi:hypothetical protein
VLYEWGALSEAEEGLAELGMKVERRPDYLVFLQPCTMLEGTRCTIYEQRPGVCAGYRCTLLKRFDAGEIAIGDALLLVEQARGLLETVQNELDAGESFRDLTMAWRAQIGGRVPATSPAADRARRMPAFMALALLNRFVDRYFRSKGETLLVSPERAAELAMEKDANGPATTDLT